MKEKSDLPSHLASKATLEKHEFQSQKFEFASKLEKHERQALLDYSGNSYSSINGALRSSKGESTTSKILSIDSALAKSAAPRDMITYRGIGGNSGKKLSQLSKGESFTDHGYFSTSTKREVAGNFTDSMSSNAIFVVHVKKGHPAAAIPSEHSHEAEILLPRGTKFTVLHVVEEMKPSWSGEMKLTRTIHVEARAPGH
jgi:hypothetical protein